MLNTSITDRLKDYSFYHVIEVEPGVYTNGLKDFQRGQYPVSEALKSINLQGRRVLDIGCRDGLFCFQAERAGASEVVGIDNDLSAGAVELLIPHFNSKVVMQELNVMDLSSKDIGTFDVIVFAGVLYHLRYPIYALRQIRNIMNKGSFLIIETAIFTGYDDLPLLYCPVYEESPYEPTSVTFFNVKGLISTLRSLGVTVDSCRLLDQGKKMIDRATLICHLDSSCRNIMLEDYWDGTHTNHSSGDPLHRFTGRKRPL